SVSLVGGGTIWYTVDGSDPRVPGTTPEPGETVSLVAENASKRVLVPTGPVDDAWRADPGFDDSAWLSGAGGVGYERSSGYESFFDIDVQNQMYQSNTGCFIRIPFHVTAADLEDITGLTLEVRYDDGFIAYLNGTEIERALADGASGWNASASTTHSDGEAVSFVPFSVSDHLDSLREGMNLLAIQGLNVSTTSSDFLISVELNGSKAPVGSATESGVSAGALRYTGPVTFPESTHIKCRALSGSTWSALNEAVFAVGPVAESLRISEIMYHPADDPNAEFVELTNVGPVTINLNLVEFVDGIGFAFDGAELAPGDFLLVVRDIAAFEARYGQGYRIAGQYTGSLDNAGERIELRDAAGRTIQSFRFRDDWYDPTDGLDFSLVARDPLATGLGEWEDRSAWRPSAAAGGSPGFDDTSDLP
ncbi:MAG: lamin tail domain-containing protein, partial [Phycisphaerales bacterium]